MAIFNLTREEIDGIINENLMSAQGHLLKLRISEANDAKALVGITSLSHTEEVSIETALTAWFLARWPNLDRQTIENFLSTFDVNFKVPRKASPDKEVYHFDEAVDHLQGLIHSNPPVIDEGVSLSRHENELVRGNLVIRLDAVDLAYLTLPEWEAVAQLWPQGDDSIIPAVKYAKSLRLARYPWKTQALDTAVKMTRKVFGGVAR